MKGLLSLVAALLLAGCVNLGSGTGPTRYYLIPSALEQERAKVTEADLRQHSLAIGPVTLAGYLDRPQLVSRIGGSRLHLMDFERWAEPLEEQIARVLGENLAVLPAAPNIYLYPWPPQSEVTDQISLDVLRLELLDGNLALLVVDFRILDPKSARETAHGRFSHRQPLADSGPEGFVTATGVNLAGLSKLLVNVLTNQDQRQN